MATPTSAAASAGASLMPSPTCGAVSPLLAACAKIYRHVMRSHPTPTWGFCKLTKAAQLAQTLESPSHDAVMWVLSVRTAMCYVPCWQNRHSSTMHECGGIVRPPLLHRCLVLVARRLPRPCCRPLLLQPDCAATAPPPASPTGPNPAAKCRALYLLSQATACNVISCSYIRPGPQWVLERTALQMPRGIARNCVKYLDQHGSEQLRTARTSWMPTSLAMRSADAGLSPVSMTTCFASRCCRLPSQRPFSSAATAAVLRSFRVSCARSCSSMPEALEHLARLVVTLSHDGHWSDVTQPSTTFRRCSAQTRRRSMVLLPNQSRAPRTSRQHVFAQPDVGRAWKVNNLTTASSP
jgi:hypothetical protein